MLQIPFIIIVIDINGRTSIRAVTICVGSNERLTVVQAGGFSLHDNFGKSPRLIFIWFDNIVK